MATLVSTLSLAQIKRLWVEQSIPVNSDGTWASKTISLAGRQRIGTLMGLGSFSEQIHNFSTSFILLIAGLYTTALVTGLSPNDFIRKCYLPTLSLVPHLLVKYAHNFCRFFCYIR